MWLWVLKLKEGFWKPQATFSPYGQASRRTGCSQSLSSLCSWGFQDLTGWSPEQSGLISQLLLLSAGVGVELSWASLQHELSFHLYPYSFERLLYLIWSILKLSDLFLISPNLNHFANLFAILFLSVILLIFIWLISRSSDLFSALTPFWEDLNFWIFLREHRHSSKPQHGAHSCRLPQHVQSICA